jgi:hypothetical protein
MAKNAKVLKLTRATPFTLPQWDDDGERVVLKPITNAEEGRPPSAEAFDACTCADCNVHIIAAGEYCYVIHNRLWNSVADGVDFLCIGCLEQRMGRRLTIDDIAWFRRSSWLPPASERLLDRLGLRAAKT